MKISESEMKIMKLIWQRGAMTAADVLDEAHEDWKITTVFTFLKRLCDKGMLEVSKDGKINYYKACVTEDEYKRSQSEEFLNDMYSGSVKNFLAALYGGDKPAKKDIDELKEWFENL